MTSMGYEIGELDSPRKLHKRGYELGNDDSLYNYLDDMGDYGNSIKSRAQPHT